MKSFDASPLFNAIPSFYRETLSSRDRSIISKLWEGMTRIVDADYAQLFQVANASKLSRSSIETLYPWVYQEFPAWENRGTRHQHVIVRAAGSSATSFVFNRRLDLNKFKLYYGGRRIPVPTGWLLRHSESGKNTELVRVNGTSTPFSGGLQITLESQRELVFDRYTGDSATSKYSFYRTNYLGLTATAVVDVDSISVNFIFPNGYAFPVMVNGKSSWGRIEATKIFFNKPLPASTSVRIVDRGNTYTVTTPSTGFHTSLMLPATVNPSLSRVFLCGVELNNITLTETYVDFNRPIKSGAIVEIEAALNNPHDHARQSFVNTLAGRTQIDIPVTRPLALTPALAEDPRYPVKVYVNGLILPSTSYVFPSTTQISLSNGLLIGDRVDVVYVDGELLDAHAHVTAMQDVVTGSALTAISLPEKVDSERYPVLIETRALSYTTGVGYLVSSGDVITADNQTFSITPAIAGPITVVVEGMIKSLEYRTTLDPRVDESERYEGTLVSAERLQDGIDVPSKTSSGESLVVQRSGSRTVVSSNYAYSYGWFVNALVDEHNIQEVFGAAVDLHDRGVSDEQYQRVVRAFYSALYTGSQTNTLENFACYILGSEIAEQAGNNGGYTVSGDGVEYLRVNDALIPLDSNIPRRYTPQAVKQFHAVNAHCEIIERNLGSIPWLAFFAEALSDDYRYAKRLDQYRPYVIDSPTGYYFNDTQWLVDYRVNFHEAEVWVGDLIEVTLNDNTKVYRRVLEVINPHTIRVSLVVTSYVYGWGGVRVPSGTNTGWGGYNAVLTSQSGWGGTGADNNIKRYVLWCRKTRQKDRQLFTDEMLDQSRALCDGEAVQKVTQKLSQTINNFLFAIRIHWEANKDIRKLEDLRLFLDRAKAADTTYFAYTEFNEGVPVKDGFSGRIRDPETEVQFIPRYTFVENDAIGSMYVAPDSSSAPLSLYFDDNWWNIATSSNILITTI